MYWQLVFHSRLLLFGFALALLSHHTSLSSFPPLLLSPSHLSCASLKSPSSSSVSTSKLLVTLSSPFVLSYRQIRVDPGL